MPVRRQEYPWSWILLSPWKGLELLGTDKSCLKWRVFSLLVSYNLAWKWILNFESRITTNQEFIPSEEYDVLIWPWMEAWYFLRRNSTVLCALRCVRQLFVCFTVKTCLGLSISCNKREKQNTNCATFLFLPHFDVICDLLLNRRTATWNLLVK